MRDNENEEGASAGAVCDDTNVTKRDREYRKDNIANERELIQWERSLLERERQLLVRERELLKQTMEQSVLQQTISKEEVISNMIPEFNPSKKTGMSAKQWIAKVEHIATAYEVENTLLTLHASSKLRGAARLWYDSFPECATAWNTFKDEILKAFPTLHDESMVNSELRNRRRKKDESIEDYFYEMLAISKRGNIGDQTLINYVIGGLNQPDLMNILALQTFDSPIDLLKMIKNYEDILPVATTPGTWTKIENNEGLFLCLAAAMVNICVSLLKWIFTIKNILYAVAIALCLNHLQHVPKDKTFTQDFIVLFYMMFIVVSLVIRSIKPYYLRVIASSAALAFMSNQHGYNWGTLLLVGVILLY